MIGRIISHYRILEKLGAGGMGVVYKAEDTRLKRIVALKFLSPQTVGDEVEKARLVHEAQAAASLDHPNICTIYEIDEVDGQTFMVMAYIEGQTVKARARSAPLSIEEALELAVQIGRGLQEAHSKGIVHRDIKSANVMVTEKGQAKIMDFGLAQLTGQTKITRTGTTVGTPAYMSPEQARGDAIDARADVWSLGVVVYEMLTGQLPFRGGSEIGVIYSILHEAPQSLAAARAGLPAALEGIVWRALAKTPAERYRTAGEMVSDLEYVRRQLESGAPSTHSHSRPLLPAAGKAIAVLPFTDMSPDKDQDYFCEGMAEEVINALAQVEGLRVVSRSSAFQFKGKSLDVREVGEKLRVGVLLEGSVRRAGNRLRITAQLVNVTDGFHLWSERYDREMKDVFDIQDEISQAIVQALKIKLVGAAPPQVRRYTDNLEAYSLYLKGRYYWNQRVPGAIRKALESFQEALALDANYAPAWAGIADCFIVPAYYGAAPPAELMPQGKQAAMKALEIDPQVAEAHASLGAIACLYEYDWTKAEQSFRKAIELNPSYAGAPMWFSLFTLTPIGRLDEALEQAKRGRDLDPLSPAPSSAVGIVAYYRRDYDRAIRELHKTLELDPKFGIGLYQLAKAWQQKGDIDRALETYQKAREALGDNPGVLGALGHCHGVAGHAAEARALLDRIEELSTQRYAPAFSRAFVYLGLGEMDTALDWLEKSYEERSGPLIWLRVDPMFDPLDGQPRFHKLLRNMRLGA